MPTCTVCRTAYENSSTECPACRASKSASEPTFGKLARYSLSVARLMSFLAAVFLVIAGVICLYQGEFWTALIVLFLAAPISYGQHVAFTLALHYMKRF